MFILRIQNLSGIPNMHGLMIFLQYLYPLCLSLSLFLSNTCRQYLCLFSSVQFSSVAQSCPTLCDAMNRSTPGLPVRHQLPEFTQTHIHRVSDAIQPSYPRSSPSPPAPNPSQHHMTINSINPQFAGFLKRNILVRDHISIISEKTLLC